VIGTGGLLHFPFDRPLLQPIDRAAHVALGIRREVDDELRDSVVGKLRHHSLRNHLGRAERD
jgi:hypothetical protein